MWQNCLTVILMSDNSLVNLIQGIISKLTISCLNKRVNIIIRELCYFFMSNLIIIRDLIFPFQT